MKWITRERPKIDRLACPWLIKRFIDPEAEFMYVPFNAVLAIAEEQNAVPFDMPGVEFSHHEDQCTFDYFLRKYGLKDPALETMAMIIRGADTDAHHLASQSSGLWAISAGLAYNIIDDHELLHKGLEIYDALYSWAKFLKKEKHTQNSVEQQLFEVLTAYIARQKLDKKRLPAWAVELKEIIQDQVDTNMSFSLKELSEELNVHPAYVSREFSKHFDNHTFGEYIRKLRIDKAIGLLKEPAHTLTQIAYLTGFSDQSHFTRIFRKYMGENPSDFRKQLRKSKKNSNS